MNAIVHELQKIPRKNWPVQIDSLSNVIGPEAAMSLFIRFNGRALHIPRTENLHSNHVITQTIGSDKAKILCKHFASEELLFPKGAYLLRRIRNEKIVVDWCNGMTQQDIATKYDLTTRSINKIIKSQKTDTTHDKPKNF